MTEDAKKSTVQHKLTMTKFNTPIRQITQKCILEHCEPEIKEPWHAAARLQLSIRCQYYRAIEKNKSKALTLTYALNCPPSGFTVKPYTNTCERHHVCPWCFSRRLVKIYDALMKPSIKIRKFHHLVVWQRTVPFNRKLPFFLPHRGPHAWVHAAVTTQIVVPYFDINTNSIQHVLAGTISY